MEEKCHWINQYFGVETNRHLWVFCIKYQLASFHLSESPLSVFPFGLKNYGHLGSRFKDQAAWIKHHGSAFGRERGRAEDRKSVAVTELLEQWVVASCSLQLRFLSKMNVLQMSILGHFCFHLIIGGHPNSTMDEHTQGLSWTTTGDGGSEF